MILTFKWSVDSVLTNVTTALLSDPTATFGVQRTDTSATVVADGTAFTNPSTGIYQYDLTEPAAGLTYLYWIEVVYAGETIRWDETVTGATSVSDEYDQRTGIRTLFRTATGLSTTDDITDAKINILLNDFYKNTFVKRVQADNFQVDYTQAVTVDDSGEYSLASNIIQVDGRITFNNEELVQYYDKDQFFNLYPSEETFNTAPTLAIGTSSAAAIKTSAFNYEVDSWTYSAAATETTMTGSTVPQNKYGAWMLSIDADGDFTVTAAGDNATGYLTPGRAVNGISTAVSSASVLGFVTAISTDAGGFIPGTTDFSDGAVTDTFTDGDPGFRGRPNACLIQGRKLFLREKSDDQGLIKAQMMLKRPDELSGDTSTVFNEEWGNAVAMGTAAAYLNLIGDRERAAEVTGSAAEVGTYQYYINSIDRETIIQDDKHPFLRSY